MGVVLAAVVWGLLALTVFFMAQGVGWMQPTLSEAAERIDAQLFLTLWVTGFAFVLVQFTLGWFIFRFRDRGTGRASYVHGHTGVEVAGIVATTVTFVTLGIMGQMVWADVHLSGTDPDAVHIEVTGEQFVWNMRYPGPDGAFGSTSPDLYEAVGNTVGIVPDDPSGKDDFIVQNMMVVPVNRPIELTLRSKDVLHNFYVAGLRIKQDAVPGLHVPLRFTPHTAGEYEIACAELCGLGHYRMRAVFKVVSASDYSTWLVDQQIAQ